MNTAQYQVSGIVNQTGKTQVKNTLLKIAGVNSVAIDLAQSTIKVGFNDPATEADIEDCIRNTGFSIEQ